jgi:hypothetical protein
MRSIIHPLVALMVALGVFGVAPARAAAPTGARISYDPTGARLTGYADYAAGLGEPGPFRIARIAEAGARGTGRILLIVNTSIYASIAAALGQYSTDLQNAGYTVATYTTSGGTPVSLRAYIRAEYDTPAGVVGVMLIGTLPVPWFEIGYDFDGADPDLLDNEYAAFPCDLFYMDLDGTWQDANSAPPFQSGVFDSHTAGSGDREPEIWVGRLTASPMTLGGATETGLLLSYLAKNHRYRTGELYPMERALAYVDDDWYDVADSVAWEVDRAYGKRLLVKDKATTCRDDYRDTRLVQSFEWMQVMLHSNATQHFFKVNDQWEMDGASLATVTNHDIETIDPVALFYNLYTCSNCRYVETDYMGGWYIFTPNYGLAATGTTKIGGMWDYATYYTRLSQGASLGAAFADWLAAQAPYDEGAVRWYYGMTLLGDGSLCLRPQILATDPSRHAVGVAPNAPVTVTFDRAMRGSSFTTSTFPVHGSRSGRHVGTYLYNTVTQSCTFHAAGEFVDGEEVTAILSRCATSSENVPSRGRAWSFTTGIGNPTPGLFAAGNAYDGGTADNIHSNDFNGDGYPDLATVNYTPTDCLKVLLNAGDGTYLAAQTYSAGLDPRSITSGDFDGDGDVDLAVSNSESGGLGIYRNNGNGTFANPTYYSSFNYPGQVVSGDFDGDGDLDLALIAGGMQQHFLMHYWNNGTGSFANQTYDMFWTSSCGIGLRTTGDLHGDGDLDLIAIRVGDYGQADDSLAVFRNDGDGGFTYATLCAVPDGPCGVCGNDFDGDGDLDLAVTSMYTTTLTVARNAGDGSIGTVSGYDIGAANSYSVCGGDWDGDGDVDLAAATRYPSPGDVRVLKNNGNGTFGGLVDYTDWGPSSMATADVDRDGDLDIAMSKTAGAGTIGVLMNSGGTDAIAPARVGDLREGDGRRVAAMLHWTAPGDDGHLGRASEYDVRYALTPVGADTVAWWNAAIPATTEPAPAFAGMPDSCSVPGLDADETYTFVLRTADEVHNWSGFSNVLEYAPGAGLPDPESVAPRTRLYASVPSPCRGDAIVHYTLGATAAVRLAVYDILGRRVRLLVQATAQTPGDYAVRWDGCDDAGGRVVSGIYFTRLEAGNRRESRRLVVLR